MMHVQASVTRTCCWWWLRGRRAASLWLVLVVVAGCWAWEMGDWAIHHNTHLHTVAVTTHAHATVQFEGSVRQAVCTNLSLETTACRCVVVLLQLQNP